VTYQPDAGAPAALNPIPAVAAPAPLPPAPPTAAPVPAAAPAVVDFDKGEHWPIEIFSLSHPFKLKGVTYTAVTMRYPTGNDLEFWAANDFNRYALAGHLSGQDKLVFSTMLAPDFMKITRWLKAFLD
jgi:hypothetical protein